MPGVCRIGDVGAGVCPNHSSPQDYTTIFVTGEGEVTADEEIMCTVGTIGVSSCGHQTIAITGSLDARAGENGIHRQGDTGANYGPYTAITGSTDVTSE